MKNRVLLSGISICAIVLFTVSLFLGFAGQRLSVYASVVNDYVDNVVSFENANACVDDSSVIVTITENATKQFRTYSEVDFKEIGCARVEDLTQYTTKYAKEKVAGVYNGESALVKTDGYKQILKLDLKRRGVKNVTRAIDILNNRNDILVAGPNCIYTLDSVPNDTYYGTENMWGLCGSYGIRAESAWNISTGSGAVTVGVLDTGIQGNHPDLQNRISTAGLHRDFTVEPAVSVSNSNLVDTNGHGTHVAGTIGAQGNNSLGLSGVCWNVRLVSLRVLDENGKGSTASITQAINFAASQNIPILNCSLGTAGNDSNLRYAISNYNGLLICAAGNDNENNDSHPIYPASYDLPNIISVGAIDSKGERLHSSNYGKTTVDIFAPGDNILSTYPLSLCPGEILVLETEEGERVFRECECSWIVIDDSPKTYRITFKSTVHFENGYHFLSGTSMAAPHVTGVAALLLAKYPNMSATEIKAAILNNVDKDSKLSELCVSGGRLNAYNALKFHHYPHDYTYDYVWKNGKQHNATCICGEGKAQPHAVSSGVTQPGSFKLCLFCGGRVEMGFIKFDGETISLVSDNGSYILPNGVIVLEEEDMEAYVRGTLKFHNKNEIYK